MYFSVGTTDKDGVPEYQEIPGSSVKFDRDEAGRKVVLGSGGFGVVYKGKYDKLGTVPVAIKQILNTQYGIRQKELDLLKKEARNMYQVRHPNILTIFGLVCDVSKQDDQLFAIITEYMERGSLEDLMEKVRVPWSVKVKMLQDVSAGLTYLYQKHYDRPYEIIHGDIKAANILIDIHFRAKISDFGSSRLHGVTIRTTKIPFQCTMTHVAPEVFDVALDKYGKADELSKPSELSDVYSFGITIFEVCAEPDGKDVDSLYRVPFPPGLMDRQIYGLIRRDMKSLFTPVQKYKIPADCPTTLYEFSELCCKVNREQRPRMKDVHSILQNMFDSELQQRYDKDMVKLFQMINANESSSEGATMSQLGGISDAITQRKPVLELRQEGSSEKEQPPQEVVPMSKTSKPESTYTKVEEVECKARVHKLCTLGNKLWGITSVNGINIFDRNCEQVKTIQHSSIVWCNGLCQASTGQVIVACGENKGLHVIDSQSYKYITQITTGSYSDVCSHNDTIYGLEYRNTCVHVFNNNSNYSKQGDIRLGYSGNSIYDKMCVNSTHIYVSVWNKNTVHIYSHSGEFLSQTGEWGDGGQAGRLWYPFLCSVSQEGNVLVADFYNARLQVCDSRGQWEVISLSREVSYPRHAVIDDTAENIWVCSGLFSGYKILKYSKSPEKCTIQ